MAKNKAKMNKFVTGVATAAMVATAVVPVASAAEFTDLGNVDAGVKADIDKAVTLGFFKDAAKFNPSAKITRGQAALTLARYIAGGDDEVENYAIKHDLESKVTLFNDIPLSYKTGQGFEKELFYASLVVKNAGAFTQSNLNPAGPVTRSQMAKIVTQTFELEKAEDYVSTITDIDHLDAATKGFIETIASQKVTVVDKFMPAGAVTRSQMASFLVRANLVAVKDPVETDSIVSVKAINDTRIEVKFGKEIDKEFIREAELSGKYFAVYTEGNAVQSNNTVQSTAINFSPDGKTATFDLKDEIESGKKYYVALLNGDNNKVSDVVHSYGPTVLKSAADAPNFEVSTVADKVFVKYNAKMKDAAKDVANYKVYDEGSKLLGNLSEFLETDAKGDWVDLNDKKEVEFSLSKTSDKKLQAGKTYKLVVDADVKTDDNKTLSESNRTIKVKTPSVKEASPVAKVARVTGKREITLFFDQDIVSPNGSDTKVNLNKAQLNLKTSTGKTVDMDKFDQAVVEGDNKLVITFNEDVFDAGLTYRVDMPANVVQNGIFTNAMNEATSNLSAKAQENVSIKTMKADIVADPKNDAKADLILTFDQVPNLDELSNSDIVLYDERDKYVLANGATIKVYGGDTSGKSIIIEDTKNFKYEGSKGKDVLELKADGKYDIEIAKDKLQTATFDDAVPATNKSKLKASTKGISISAPIIDEVILHSADKIEVIFEENIKGNVKASDITVNAFVANRSDIFEGNRAVLEAAPVSGSGYFDVKVSGDTLTLTAKTGVKFPTSAEATNIIVDEKVFTNSTGRVGNPKLDISEGDFDFVDNAAPVVISAHADRTANEVTVTYSEAVKLQGKEKDVATLFFSDKGENASEGVEYNGNGEHNNAVITFNKDVRANDTDLSIVTLKYAQGNSYYIQDLASNKMKTETLKGFFTTERESTPGEPGEPGDGGEETPEGEVTVKATEFAKTVTVVKPLGNTGNITMKEADINAKYAGKEFTFHLDGEELTFIHKNGIYSIVFTSTKDVDAVEKNLQVKVK